MKKVKYLGLIMIMALMLTGCGSTTDDKTNKEDNKPIAVNPPSETGYTGVKKIVYLDPTDLNKKCTEEDVKSDDETKSGCMKWYAYKEEDDTYTLILDHNTTNLMEWITKSDYLEAGGSEDEWNANMLLNLGANNSKGPISAEKRLKSDTSNWDNSLNPRLIKASEIREITGYKENDTYYFETNTPHRDSMTSYPSPSKYGWLFDRTSQNCKDYGCLNNAITKGNEYWTDTSYSKYSNASALYVTSFGNLESQRVSSDWKFGIRPVITIQKSSLSFVETNEEQ